jgi:hypothetical protein
MEHHRESRGRKEIDVGPSLSFFIEGETSNYRPPKQRTFHGIVRERRMKVNDFSAG